MHAPHRNVPAVVGMVMEVEVETAVVVATAAERVAWVKAVVETERATAAVVAVVVRVHHKRHPTGMWLHYQTTPNADPCIPASSKA